MTGKKGRNIDDHELEQSLNRWANANVNESAASPDFLARLRDIPSAHSQARQPFLVRVLKAVGGWGFAAPQLAGFVVAAWLGVTSGTAVYADDSAFVVEETMSAHIFGSDDLLEE